MEEREGPRRRLSVEEVRAHRDEIHRLAERHGVTQVRVFGSVARGEAGDNSDLDLLIEVEPGRGLFDLAEFALDVEDLLGVFTQVVTVAGLRSRVRERVIAEAVAV